MTPADATDDARHWIRMAGRVEGRARVVDVDAFERRGEPVGVALATDLAVCDDVEPRILLRLDRGERGVVLRFGEERLRDAPQFARANARRKAARQLRTIDEPFWLR